MHTDDDLRKLIEANPGVDMEKVQAALERLRAGGITKRGYRLADPLDRRRVRVVEQDGSDRKTLDLNKRRN